MRTLCKRHLVGLLAVILLTATVTAAETTVDSIKRLKEGRPVGEPPVVDAISGTSEAESAPSYEENSAWEDFQVHFLISLPFTALYSYLTVSSLDALVQGAFPTDLREADIWVIIGLAAGGSLAVALGSAGRVPDQSRAVPEAGTVAEPGPISRAGGRIQLVRLDF